MTNIIDVSSLRFSHELHVGFGRRGEASRSTVKYVACLRVEFPLTEVEKAATGHLESNIRNSFGVDHISLN